MSDGERGPGWRPGYGGPGYGYYPGSSSSSSPSSSSSGGSTLPVWALVLIMVASGLVTLIFLWLCVLFICRKRRARRAAARDLELQTAWAAERDSSRLNPPVFGEKDVDLSDVKRCEADNVELTYVVMAGEEQPSFLARPALTIPSSDQEVPPSSPPPPPPPPPPAVLTAEAVSESPQKTPPSPSR